MILPIVTVPTESLRIRSTEVDRDVLLSDDTQTFIDNMIPTMYDDDGIGLAAPQVGNNIRICVVGKEAVPNRLKVSTGDINPREDLVLVNPVWQKTSRKTAWDTEGCLSVPRTFGKVKRYTNIAVTAQDRHGNDVAFDASAFFARVIQHEVDHLDGILFIDKAKDVYTVDESELLSLPRV